MLILVTRNSKDILKSLSPKQSHILFNFYTALSTTLRTLARDPVVVGFKSVVAYRTGLNVAATSKDPASVERGIITTVSSWKEKAGGSDVLRLADKALNDFVVRTALSIATEFNKPGKYPSSGLSMATPHLNGKGPSSSSIPHWDRRCGPHPHTILPSPHATTH